MSVRAELSFFSFIKLTDPLARRPYNEWHQLDHRPENIALPGVLWGDRWALTEQCAALARGEGALLDIDYIATYSFQPPIDEAIAEWTRLGEASFQWGRGPMLPGIERRLLAFFRPVQAYAATTALVSPEVIPFRPNRGIHVTVTRLDEPHSVAAHEFFAREDREVIPALMQVPGVAGAWTYAYSHPQRHDTLKFEESAVEAQGSLRVRVLFLDEDPCEVTPRIEAVPGAIDVPVGGTLQLAAPLATIIPWQDW
jgi:hypothetical protein